MDIGTCETKNLIFLLVDLYVYGTKYTRWIPQLREVMSSVDTPAQGGNEQLPMDTPAQGGNEHVCVSLLYWIPQLREVLSIYRKSV